MKVPESDELLVHKTTQGETGAFGKLVDRYQHRVFSLALGMVGHREDARDITQETFIKAFNSLPDFRHEGGFKNWILRIASNTCLDHLRRRSRDTARRIERPPEPGGGGLESLPSPGPGPEESLIRSERESEVRKALEELPESYRLPLLMQHYQRMSYREMSTALGIPEKTVATRLYRAKMMLKDLLLGGDHGEVQSGAKKNSGPAGRRVHAL